VLDENEVQIYHFKKHSVFSVLYLIGFPARNGLRRQTRR
jgi:hypothetical protein